MKKDTKVIIIRMKGANGNDRVIRAIAPLDWTVADVIKMKNIPMLAIRSTEVSAPMTMEEATCYTMNDFAAQVFAPNTMLVRCSYTEIAA